MRRRTFDECAVYELCGERDAIDFSEIRHLFLEKTADIVYLTLNGRIYGIVCMGDVLHHMKNGKIEIVRNFTFLEDFQDALVREIFDKRSNIQKIPVIKEGRLEGDYSRWDDAEIEWIKWVSKRESTWNRLKKWLKTEQYQRLYILEPVREKQEAGQIIADVLKTRKIEVCPVKKKEFREAVSNSEKCLMITTDQDEERGMICVNEADHNVTSGNLDMITFTTLYDILDKYDRQERIGHYSIVFEGEGVKENSLESLERKGVHILAFYNDPYHISDYIKKIVRKQAEDKKKFHLQDGEFWAVDTEAGEEFFAELLKNRDYVQGMAQKEILRGHMLHKDGKDCADPYYTVVNGKRKTCYQPKEWKGTIYMFGMCLFMGAYLENRYTIASWLQKKLCDEGWDYRVESCGSYENVYEVMQRTEFQEGDIAIVWTGENTFPGIDSVELKCIYEENDIPARWCLGSFTHVNHKIAKIIAETFYQKMEPILQKEAGATAQDRRKIKFTVENYRNILGNYIKGTYLNRYFTKDEQEKRVRRGCLLIDLGVDPSEYKEIVQHACTYVEELVIVIPKLIKKSMYCFEEYVLKVMRMLGDTSKIKVISGDMYIPYYNFFQSYYLSEMIWDEQAQMDAKIFAQCIAEPLNIVYRFERSANKNDKKTEQYAEILKRELPKYEIQYMELIP